MVKYDKVCNEICEFIYLCLGLELTTLIFLIYVMVN